MEPLDAKVASWTFAGIMLSYWCSARCAFCYVSGGPDAKHWAAPVDVVRWWRELAALTARDGKRIKIHVTGGEPFGNWSVLREVAARAHAEGLTAGGSFQKVETNAFWATDPRIVRTRLAELDRLGMRKLVVSTDPYHQQFVSPQNVRTCVAEARRVLGPDRVQVRWLDWYERMEDLREVDAAARQERFREALGRHRERLTGRAALDLATLLALTPTDQMAVTGCSEALLRSGHVHVDPYGNIFAGTCAGIILGNAQRTPMPEIWRQLAEDHRRDPLLRTLVESGPHVLLRYARMLGFEPRSEGYASKCHLCACVRGFLFANSLFEGRIGPERCYAESCPSTAAPRRG